MKPVDILVHNPPFLIPTREKVEDHQCPPRQPLRWETAIYWLLIGQKGRHWCQAPGRTAAMHVYNNIPWDGMIARWTWIVTPARDSLAPGVLFWAKLGKGPSQPFRMHRDEMAPAPDGYDQIEPPRHNE